ncbi:MAG: hypothetical protein PHV28_13840, partial [Kiritimatiellae bacterium]|nr:hypothetical protein [Kiritimatiellia bacterium]
MRQRATLRGGQRGIDTRGTSGYPCLHFVAEEPFCSSAHLDLLTLSPSPTDFPAMTTATRIRSVINAWETVRYELMNTRISDLSLRIEGSPVETYVLRLKNEFAERRFTFVPSFYLTDSWGCPNEVPVIGIPFYLADKRLSRIEEEQTGEIEDGDTIMMLLRHEAGHAVNYAYRLWLDKEWNGKFGSFNTPYRDAFSPDPFSRQFVRHLTHGQYHLNTYAQKHPDED